MLPNMSTAVGPRSLPLFIKHEFRVGPVLRISTDQDELHIREDAEAAVSAKLGLELVPEIGGLVVEEFRGHAAREAVREIDIAADQRVEGLHFGHALDGQRVDLPDSSVMFSFTMCGTQTSIRLSMLL